MVVGFGRITGNILKNKIMSYEEILDGKMAIADFLGWGNYGDGRTYKVPNLYPIFNIDDKENTGWVSEQIAAAEFDTSWDWLMPVVKKIIHLDILDFSRKNGVVNALKKADIQILFVEVVKFAKWFNKQENAGSMVILSTDKN